MYYCKTMRPSITIICASEEMKMFYMPLTIEPQRKITLLAPNDIIIKTGERLGINLKLSMESDEPILIYPSSELNSLPLIVLNLNNVYDKDNHISILNNPERGIYKKFVDAGIDSFKTDILRQLTKKRNNDEIIAKILAKVPACTIPQGSPLFKVYTHSLKEFDVIVE